MGFQPTEVSFETPPIFKIGVIMLSTTLPKSPSYINGEGGSRGYGISTKLNHPRYILPSRFDRFKSVNNIYRRCCENNDRYQKIVA